MFALYITHPQVRIDPTVPVPLWGLSEVGAARANTIKDRPWVGRLRRIVSSAETKAIETAEILASVTGINVEIVEAMHENDRSATGFLAPPEFEEAADWFFANPDKSFHGWESAADAQSRIVGEVMSVLDNHDASHPIAFVGHGAVGTLLKCHLAGVPISRAHDQPGGGGNLFAFSLADRSLSCDWTPIENWRENDKWP
ncbi:histidine phosphatase family protein [Ciceribacter sp. L1K23]|uniref:histidine phosphatase family protein n=1 Tax=Ciceribacter sp. L1K23 TaxID=2820276 RepID=UPI001B843770|nr:histidine phosphatase family protein [Ciceribacter sp. L1K23]MBR0557310.1 histidine phosphatase family protein [Ciceribacter sp. L1K23]